MHIVFTHPAKRACVIAVALATGAFIACTAWGQGRHEGPGRAMHEPYRTPHLIFDDRYHHGHYYPVVGYAVSALPPGYLTVGFPDRRFYFHGGVWYQPAPRGFVVVRPPFGLVVPVLPPAYATVWAVGTTYYYANDAYYVEAPGGYAVAAPPAGTAQSVESPAPPQPVAPASAAPQPAAPASAPPQAPTQVWYYCDASKSYYPYVAECKDGWRSVPAVPPGAR